MKGMPASLCPGDISPGVPRPTRVPERSLRKRFLGSDQTPGLGCAALRWWELHLHLSRSEAPEVLEQRNLSFGGCVEPIPYGTCTSGWVSLQR